MDSKWPALGNGCVSTSRPESMSSCFHNYVLYLWCPGVEMCTNLFKVKIMGPDDRIPNT